MNIHNPSAAYGIHPASLRLTAFRFMSVSGFAWPALDTSAGVFRGVCVSSLIWDNRERERSSSVAASLSLCVCFRISVVILHSFCHLHSFRLLTRTGGVNLYTDCELTADHSHAKHRRSPQKCCSPFPRSLGVRNLLFFSRVVTSQCRWKRFGHF